MPQGQAARIPNKRRIVQGNQIVCPGCNRPCNPGYHLRALDRPEQYETELNIVYVHNKDRGGCGHVFSPGDPWVMQAYLQGDLVPRSLLDTAMTLNAQLEAQLATAKETSSDNKHDEERRRTAA